MSVFFQTLPIKRGFTEEAKALFKLATEHKSIVAGGYVRFMASPREEPVPADDFDIFTPDDACFSAICLELAKRGYKATVDTVYYRNFIKESLTLMMVGKKPLNVQIVKPQVKGDESKVTLSVDITDPQKLIKRFDFSIIRVALISETEILADVDFYRNELNLNLNIKYIRNPVFVLKRMIKYAVKGYSYHADDVLKLFTYWNERDEETRTKTIEAVIKAGKGAGYADAIKVQQEVEIANNEIDNHVSDFFLEY